MANEIITMLSWFYYITSNHHIIYTICRQNWGLDDCMEQNMEISSVFLIWPHIGYLSLPASP